MSEFTGSSRALQSATVVNPWSAQAVSVALEKAARRVWTREECESFQIDATYLTSGSTLQWAEELLTDLRRSRKKEGMTFTSCGFGAGFRVLGWEANFRYVVVCGCVCVCVGVSASMWVFMCVCVCVCPGVWTSKL